MFNSVHIAEQIQEQLHSKHFTSIICLSSDVWAEFFSNLSKQNDFLHLGHDLRLHIDSENSHFLRYHSYLFKVHDALSQAYMVGFDRLTYCSLQHGVHSKSSFLIKALMKDSPYLFLGAIIGITVTFFGIVIRNLERYEFNFNL